MTARLVALLLLVVGIVSFVQAQYDDGMFGSYGRPMGAPRARGRYFGLPNAAAITHDNFDTEKTRDEVISARMNPLPFIFNPGMRVGIGALQRMEARSQQNPVARAVYSPVLSLMSG
jgi:hypothetical protein